MRNYNQIKDRSCHELSTVRAGISGILVAAGRCSTEHTLHETNIAPENRGPLKEISSSNHWFSGAMLDSGRVSPSFWNKTTGLGWCYGSTGWWLAGLRLACCMSEWPNLCSSIGFWPQAERATRAGREGIAGNPCACWKVGYTGIPSFDFQNTILENINYTVDTENWVNNI